MGLSFSQVGNSDAGKTMSAFAQWAGVEIGKFFPKNLRLARILEKGGIATVRDLVVKTEAELVEIRGISDATVEKIRERLTEEQLHLGYDEMEELRAENARLRESLDRLRSSIGTLNEKFNDSLNENDELRATVSSLSSECASFDRYESTLRQNLAEERGRVNVLDRRNTELQNEVNRLEKLVTSLRIAVKSLSVFAEYAK